MKKLHSRLLKNLFFLLTSMALQPALFAQEPVKSISILAKAGHLLPLWLWITLAVIALIVVATVITRHTDTYRIIMKNDNSRKKKRILDKELEEIKG